MSDTEEPNLGTVLPYEQIIATAEKWIPELQKLDSADEWGLQHALYMIREVEDTEYYLDVMSKGISILKDKTGTVPSTYIKDVIGFLAPKREEDYGVQSIIRFKLDKLGIPT